jgi:hypothetical protein
VVEDTVAASTSVLRDWVGSMDGCANMSLKPLALVLVSAVLAVFVTVLKVVLFKTLLVALLEIVFTDMTVLP